MAKKKKTAAPKTTSVQTDYTDAFQKGEQQPAPQAPAAPAPSMSGVARGEYTPGVLETFSNLPPAWIPVNTVVDKQGFAVAVDVNGYDINGNIVIPATKEDLKVLTAGEAANITALDEAATLAAKAADSVAEAAGQLKAVSPSSSGTPTTQRDVIKEGLKALRFKSNIIDSSATFLEMLMSDGIAYNDAIEILLSSKNHTLKSGTTLDSPFYREYTSLAELSPASDAKTPEEIFNFVLGVEDIVTKYNLSNKWAQRDSLEKYVKNSVNVADLDLRANVARLKGITADPVYVDALQKLGFIKTGQDLTDFYMDPDIGKQVFEQRRGEAALATEALRRASSGIKVDANRIRQLTAALAEQGMTPEEISGEAARSYETISQQLPGLTKLSSMYDRTAKPVSATEIQQELEAEQMLGMPSQRRKRLEEREQVEFESRPGRARTKINIAGLV